VGLRKTGLEGVGRFHVAKVKDRLWAFVNTITNLLVSTKGEPFREWLNVLLNSGEGLCTLWS
jgi:hypothetical protein